MKDDEEGVDFDVDFGDLSFDEELEDMAARDKIHVVEDHHDEEPEEDVEEFSFSFDDDDDDGEEDGAESDDDDEDDGEIFAGDVLDEEPTVIPSDDDVEDFFTATKLPNVAQFKEEFNGAPRVYLGPYALVSVPRNIDVYLYSKNKVRTGKKKGQAVTKFRLLGHYSSMEGALRCIQEDINSKAIAASDNRHLIDAIRSMDRQITALRSCAEKVRASLPTSGKKQSSDES